MSSWIETIAEIAKRNNNTDNLRRERIRAVEQATGRPLAVYATAFLDNERVQASNGEVSIDARDKIGFEEVIGNIDGQDLDVLLHSPGGSPEAAEAIVALLRSRFSSLRFIVPNQAKSAATMICCAGDAILMDERSELGPIDPQMVITRADRTTILSPAQAILKQFDLAKTSLAKNPNHVTAWLPLLQPLGPSLLIQCEAANELSQRLVQTWLTSYMFKNLEDKDSLAQAAAQYLGSSDEHHSHARRIGLEQLRKLSINVLDMRETPEVRGVVWDLFLAILATFEGTGAYKIIENGRGRAYIRLLRQMEFTLRGPAAPTEDHNPTNRPPTKLNAPGKSGPRPRKRH